jgi:hypothetical protein
MITPADVADYQVRSDESSEQAVDLEDVFEDSLSSIDDALGEATEASDLEADTIEEHIEQSEEIEEPRGVSALSDIWESDEEEGKVMEAIDETIAGTQIEEGLHDIFAAPAVVSTAGDELFGAPAKPEGADPIVRATRSVQSPPRLIASPGVPVPGYESPCVGSHGDLGSSALKSAAQDFQQVHHERSSSGAREYVDWKRKSKLVGFLVSYAGDSTGSYIELREGRLLVTSGQTSTDSCFVIAHETVSPMHAIMRISADGSILILDQLSEHGTRIRRGETGNEESLMGDKSTIYHGDVVIFGECEYHAVVMGSAALKRGE